MPSPSRNDHPLLSRHPAVPVAAAFAVGIALDRCAGGEVWTGFALGSLALLGVLAFRQRSPAASAVCLLVACGSLGHAWHHCAWSMVRRDSLAAIARDASAPIKLVGRVCDTPVVVPPREDKGSLGIPKLDRTICTIEVTALDTAGQRVPASGRARLEVSGHLLGVDAGDEIEAVGRIQRPSAPQNPGGFDFRAFLRTWGIHAIVRCSEPDGVRVLRAGNDPRRVLGRIRAEAERLLTRNLSDETAPIGVAMLLGTRTSLPEDVRDAFRKSGTMHVLAISGLHVAILAGLAWSVCRGLALGRRTSLVAVLAMVLAYAAITDAQPSVVRSVVMIAILLAGRFQFRAGTMLNSLAISALVVLAWNPSHLFDTGAQLSFLAVAALAWAPSWQKPAGLPAAEDGLVTTLLRGVGRHLWSGLEATTAVWLFTLPLTITTFHLVSPLGFLLNVVLAPLSVGVLWAGYLLLIFGFACPPAAVPFGLAFDAGLRGLLWLVQATARSPWGSLSVTGPPVWWQAGFYAILGVLVISSRRSLAGRLALRGICLWTVIGLGLGLSAPPEKGLRATFLSVGHGVAVLVELPNGRTLLYDAGQLQDGHRAQQIVQSALWKQGRTRVDVLVISHADVDHFNAVPHLAAEGAIGTALMHPSFLDFRQEPVAELCERCFQAGVPLKFLWAGDRVRLDDAVEIDVLHPHVSARFQVDNANSLVLRITYAGRSLLLTGDLEADGLSSLLTMPRQLADVLLAPHHGARNANPPALAAWAGPCLVVASTGYEGTEDRLRAVYGDSGQVWSTRDRGSVAVTIDPDGTLAWNPAR